MGMVMQLSSIHRSITPDLPPCTGASTTWTVNSGKNDGGHGETQLSVSYVLPSRTLPCNETTRKLNLFLQNPIVLDLHWPCTLLLALLCAPNMFLGPTTGAACYLHNRPGAP